MPNGSLIKDFFGLPENPVSSMVFFEKFKVSALRRIMGQATAPANGCYAVTCRGRHLRCTLGDHRALDSTRFMADLIRGFPEQMLSAPTD